MYFIQSISCVSITSHQLYSICLQHQFDFLAGGSALVTTDTNSLLEAHNYIYIVEPVYYGHLGTNQRCPDYQGVLIFQVSLYDKAPFRTIARCPDYAGVHIFKCPD